MLPRSATPYPDLALALTSFYDCWKGVGCLGWRLAGQQELKETLSSMIPNPKLPAVRQHLLFSPVAQRLVELPSDKQRELRTAIAELLLNVLTGDDPIDSGETDDECEAHA
ncbi:MAG TPA: hypothetical protein VFC29_25375 [Candidatus Limnocylindrales bacterium]|jgi:hypothetical protein|nr:hypothetical protein [Candidatus Limnocylindrales bacterium]